MGIPHYRGNAHCRDIRVRRRSARFTLLPKRLAVQIGLLILLLLLTRDAFKIESPLLRGSILSLPVIVYFATTTIAVAQAHNRVAAIESVSHLLTYVLVFFCAVQILDRSHIPRLAEALCWAGGLASLIGIGEFWGLDLSGFPSNGRPSSTFGYRNMAASYLVVCIPIAIGLVATTRSRRTYGIATAATALMSVFLVYTRTRGAWAALMVAGAATGMLCLIYRPTRSPTLSSSFGKRLAVAMALLVLALGPWNPNLSPSRSRHLDEGKTALLDALSSASRPGADRGRRTMWSHTLAMIGDYPVLGVGPGNWQYAYPPYDGGDMLKVGSAPERPHNDYLWIAAETGLIGLATYFWMLAAALSILLRAVRNAQTRTWGLAIGASLMASLGHAVFSFPKELAETSLLFWLNLALLVTLHPPSSESQSIRSSKTTWILATGLACGCLAFTIQALRFDRHLMRALSFHAGNDLRATLAAATAALEIGPFDTRAHLLQAKGYRAIGQYGRAIDAGRTGLAYHPHRRSCSAISAPITPSRATWMPRKHPTVDPSHWLRCTTRY